MLFRPIFLLWLIATCASYSQSIESPSIQENAPTADVPFSVVNHVPVYPGCTGNDNEVLKKCMTDKIAKHVSKNFNFSLAKSFNLRRGKHRIGMSFKIDKEGQITDIKAIAPNKALEEEGIRVISLLPKMKPGKQRGQSVGVLYSIPILFEIEGKSRPKKKNEPSTRQKSDPIPFSKLLEHPIYPGCSDLDKSAIKKCTENGISEFVKKRFNTRLFRGMNLNEKRVKIYVQFTIDSNGNVQNVKARGPHPKLEKEAKKIVELLPNMTPGKSKNVKIATTYSLPLVFVLG